jgi:hypothetical protein
MDYKKGRTKERKYFKVKGERSNAGTTKRGMGKNAGERLARNRGVTGIRDFPLNFKWVVH